MSKRNGSKELKVTKRYVPDIQAQVAALEILLRSSPAKEAITENGEALTDGDNV